MSGYRRASRPHKKDAMTSTHMYAGTATQPTFWLFRLISGIAAAALLFSCVFPAKAVIAQEAGGSSSALSDSQGIAAIVNDRVISSYDLDQRVKLVLLSSGIPNTPENISRIRGQVLRSLVDEFLQMQ